MNDRTEQPGQGFIFASQDIRSESGRAVVFLWHNGDILELSLEIFRATTHLETDGVALVVVHVPCLLGDSVSKVDLYGPEIPLGDLMTRIMFASNILLGGIEKPTG